MTWLLYMFLRRLFGVIATSSVEFCCSTSPLCEIIHTMWSCVSCVSCWWSICVMGPSCNWSRFVSISSCCQRSWVLGLSCSWRSFAFWLSCWWTSLVLSVYDRVKIYGGGYSSTIPFSRFDYHLLFPTQNNQTNNDSFVQIQNKSYIKLS